MTYNTISLLINRIFAMSSLRNQNQPFLQKRYYRNFAAWIFGHIMHHKFLFLSSYAIMFLNTLADTAIALLLQQFFDNINKGVNIILFISFEFLALSVLILITDFSSGTINTIVSEYIIRNVQIEFFESLHQKNMKFHDSARTGELLSLTTFDSRQLNFMLVSIRMTIMAIFTTITVISAMFYLYGPLMYIFLFFIPISLWSMYRYGKNLAPVTLKRQQYYAKWQATLQENIAGIRVLRTLSNKGREYDKFETDLTAVREILIKRAILSERYFPSLYIYIEMGLLFIIGAYFVLIGNISVGTLIAFNSLVVLLQGPISMIGSSVFLGSTGFAGGKRIYDVIKEQQITKDGSANASNIKGEIEFQNVFFSYGDNTPPVLTNINFKILPGQTVAILGPTGSGKSTLCKLIQRLYDVNEGKILIDGENIKDYNLEELRKKIGVIEQDVFLFSTTIRENILYGKGSSNDPSQYELMVQVAKAAQIHDFVETLPEKYETIIGERGITLSGGQRQRLAIARAFAINPTILIMDDSTASVDAQTEANIQKAIRNLIKSRTTLMITHRLSAFRNADLVILIKDGMIKDIGKHEELYQRNEDYASIFRQYENLPEVSLPVAPTAMD